MKAAIENMAADKPCCVHALDHISRLPDADKARQQLEELKRHIDPILRARGLRVTMTLSVLGSDVSRTHRVSGPRKQVYFLKAAGACWRKGGRGYRARG